LANTRNRRFSVGYDAVATPVSSKTRSESALLVGSMIRASTNWRPSNHEANRETLSFLW
jgi:hypothetical protein